MVVFMPALLAFSLAKNLSADLVAQGAYVLVGWAVVHMLISTAVGAFLRWALSIPKFVRLEFLLALISSNNLSLPLVLLEPLLQLDQHLLEINDTALLYFSGLAWALRPVIESIPAL